MQHGQSLRTKQYRGFKRMQRNWCFICIANVDAFKRKNKLILARHAVC